MCGITAVMMKGPLRLDTRAAWKTARALRRLQHRGHEGAGICVAQTPGLPFHFRRGSALVMEVLADSVCGELPGSMALAQNRYSTAGEKNDPDPTRNLGPFTADTKYGRVAVVHNGNLKGATALREELKRKGVRFQSGTDTEVFLQFIAQSQEETLKDAIIDALGRIPIAYAFIVMGEDCLFAMRDPKGIRPLLLGEDDESYVLASETSAIEVVGAKVSRRIAPGELLEISPHGLTSHRFAPEQKEHRCIFEDVYFARPDNMDGGVQEARMRAGALLAKHHRGPAGAVVVGIPNSGLSAANGYARELQVPLTMAFVRDDYEGRAFMRPTDKKRNDAVLLKHAVIKRAVSGKDVVLADDSLVRGKTLEPIIAMMRKAGATSVHVRIASPMVVHPCWFGIDTPSHGELFAHQHATEADMARQLRADSVAFLTIEELQQASREATGDETYCMMCFDGKPELILDAA